MYGIGILKGLSVTIKHFVATFVDDLQWVGRRNTQDTFTVKQGLGGKGMYTVQYPEEKIAVPERFRFVPFLVTYNQDDPEYPGKDWCTSCGICAKVCPPQCIWIVRGTNPETGRPKPEPEQFYIDIDICMNCGYCAEYCPFDAIKMDHDYEFASYDRTGAHIRDHDQLARPVSYWQHIAPTTAAQEQIDRKGYDHSDVQKLRVKQGLPPSRPGPVSDKPEPPKPAAAPIAAAPVLAAIAGAPAPVVVAPQVPATPTAPAVSSEGKPVVRRRSASAPVGTTPDAAAPVDAAPVATAPVAPAAPTVPAGAAEGKPVVRRRSASAPASTASAAPVAPAPEASTTAVQVSPVAPAAAATTPEAPAAPATEPNKPAVVVRRRNAPPPKKD